MGVDQYNVVSDKVDLFKINATEAGYGKPRWEFEKGGRTTIFYQRPDGMSRKDIGALVAASLNRYGENSVSLVA